MSNERTSQLRAAIHRRDGEAVVATLSGGPLDADQLQLIGEGLRVAVVTATPGADPLALACVAALRDREWPGDELLADHLDALAGRRPVALLRPLAVSLDELGDVLEGDPLYGGGRIDRRTGDVWHQAQIEYAIEVGDEDPEKVDPDRWLWVESEGSTAGYRDMERFIATVPDPHRAELLAVAIEGRGAFRRFRDVLHRWPDLVQRWQVFSDDRRLGRAREWLADAGFRPSDGV